MTCHCFLYNPITCFAAFRGTRRRRKVTDIIKILSHRRPKAAMPGPILVAKAGNKFSLLPQLANRHGLIAGPPAPARP